MSVGVTPNRYTVGLLVTDDDAGSLEPAATRQVAMLYPDEVFDLMLNLMKARGQVLPPDPSGDPIRQTIAGLRGFLLHVADTLADEDAATASVIRQTKHSMREALSIRAKVIDYKARPMA